VRGRWRLSCPLVQGDGTGLHVRADFDANIRLPLDHRQLLMICGDAQYCGAERGRGWRVAAAELLAVARWPVELGPPGRRAASTAPTAMVRTTPAMAAITRPLGPGVARAASTNLAESVMSAIYT
jgi:hypothetical protein